jgi:hypothetical protein
MSFILLGILNAQAAGAGGAGAYDLLETQILESSASSVEFTGLGSYSDYKHLQLRVLGRSSDSFVAVGGWMILNNDSSSVYATHNLRGTGSSVISQSGTSANRANLIGWLGNTATANAFTALVTDILDFSSTSKATTMRTLFGQTVSGSNEVELRSHLYTPTSAITSIELVPSGSNFVTGSRFSLYGIKGE